MFRNVPKTLDPNLRGFWAEGLDFARKKVVTVPETFSDNLVNAPFPGKKGQQNATQPPYYPLGRSDRRRGLRRIGGGTQRSYPCRRGQGGRSLSPPQLPRHDRLR
jgi:hypothetical protein